MCIRDRNLAVELGSNFADKIGRQNRATKAADFIVRLSSALVIKANKTVSIRLICNQHKVTYVVFLLLQQLFPLFPLRLSPLLFQLLYFGQFLLLQRLSCRQLQYHQRHVCRQELTTQRMLANWPNVKQQKQRHWLHHRVQTGFRCLKACTRIFFSFLDCFLSAFRVWRRVTYVENIAICNTRSLFTEV